MTTIARTKDEAIKILDLCLTNNSLEKIRTTLSNINSILFGDYEDGFKTLITFAYETENLMEIKLKIEEFLVVVKEQPQNNIIASKLFIQKFKDLKNKVIQNEIMNLIQRINENKRNYPTETIGSYFISPRGHSEKRIIWKLQDNKVILEDFFISHKEYDEFCTKLKYGRMATRKRFSSHTTMSLS